MVGAFLLAKVHTDRRQPSPTQPGPEVTLQPTIDAQKERRVLAFFALGESPE